MNIQRRAHGITARVAGKTCQFGVSEVREEGVVFEGSSLALTQFFYACKSRGEAKGSLLGFFLHYTTFSRIFFQSKSPFDFQRKHSVLLFDYFCSGGTDEFSQ